MKEERFDELASLLDLFDGKLSLNDVLNQDILILNKLKEAKIRLNAEVNKERQKKAEQAAKAQQTKKQGVK